MTLSHDLSLSVFYSSFFLLANPINQLYCSSAAIASLLATIYHVVDRINLMERKLQERSSRRVIDRYTPLSPPHLPYFGVGIIPLWDIEESLQMLDGNKYEGPF